MRHARQALIACHLHLLGIRLAVLVVSILILVLALGLRRLRLLGLVLLLLLGRLHLAQGLPLLREDIRLGLVVSDDDVVEDAAALDLPEVEADEAEVGIRVDRLLIHVLRVRDLLGLPEALVAWVRDALHGPVALVLRIVLRGRLPLAVLLIVPVVRLLGISVHHALLLHPIGGLLVLRVVHHGVVDPVAGFLVVRVGNLLGREHLPILLQGALVDFLLIDLHDYRVVRLHHQPVDVRSALALLLVGQVRLLQHVLALVVEDQVSPLGVAALVRAKHDVVDRRVAEGRGIAHLRADLHVAATALHVLLVLGLVLNDQLLALVAEGVEACRKAEELGVLAGLDAPVLDLIREPLAGAGDPLARCALALLPLARSPTALPAITKGLREVDFAAGHAHKAHAKRSSAHHSWKMG
mmetsp:Transcript_81898/g.264360  ORF Transcript_81898/g.264360 Transcript_81898/m.264360 type:complete len:411 (-) Transcript_81898:74-1306(-)